MSQGIFLNSLLLKCLFKIKLHWVIKLIIGLVCAYKNIE